LKTFLAVFFGILAAVAVIATVIGIGVLVKQEQQSGALRSEMPAHGLKTIAISCETYKSFFGHYPKALADLGYKDGKIEGDILKDPKNAGLIDPYLSSGKIYGYIFSYTVDAADKRGSPTSYSVIASPASGSGKRFFVDQTGVVRFTTENRPASATDIPDFSMDRQ